MLAVLRVLRGRSNSRKISFRKLPDNQRDRAQGVAIKIAGRTKVWQEGVNAGTEEGERRIREKRIR